MAIISVGYDGTINESQWSDMIKKVGSSGYGVVGVDDWKVTAVTAADRTVSVAIGNGWGHGVYDEITAPIAIQLDTIGAGSRWDLIAMKRDWTGVGGVSTIVKRNGTLAKVLPTDRLVGPGVIDEQPIALVRVTAGQTQPTAIVDLRAWAGPGGMFVKDMLALTYLDEVGSCVQVGTRRFFRSINSGGVAEWTATPTDTALPVFGAGTSLAGGIAPDGGNFLIQAGTQVARTDGAGFARVTFPKPFPNGLLTVILTNGDSSVDRVIWSHVINFALAGSPWTTGGTSTFEYSMAVEDAMSTKKYYPCLNSIHRINWLAIGW